MERVTQGQTATSPTADIDIQRPGKLNPTVGRLADNRAPLISPDIEGQKKELVTYKKLRLEIRNIFASAPSHVQPEFMVHAIHVAVERLERVGPHNVANVDKAVRIVKKDLIGAIHDMGPHWEAFSDKRADLFCVWHDRGSAFLDRAATAVGEGARRVGWRLEHQIYRTGEMTYGGTLKCIACGKHLILRTAVHLNPCSYCGRTEFRRM